MSETIASSSSCIPLPTNTGSTVHYSYANILCSSSAPAKPTLLCGIKNKSCENSSKKVSNSNLLKVIPIKSLQTTSNATRNKKSFMDLRSKGPDILTRSNTFTRNGNKNSECQKISCANQMLDSTKKSMIINKQKCIRSYKNATSCATKINSEKDDAMEVQRDKLGLGTRTKTNLSNIVNKAYCTNRSKLKLSALKPPSNLKQKYVKNYSLNQLENSARPKHNSSENLIVPSFLENIEVKTNFAKSFPDNQSKIKLILKKPILKDKDNISGLSRDNLQTDIKSSENNTKELERSALKAQSQIMINELKKDKTGKKHVAFKYRHLPNSSVSIKTAQSDLALSPYSCVEYKDDKAISHNLATSLQDINHSTDLVNTKLFLGLEFAESILDCSIELVDVSLSSTVISQNAFSDANYTNYLLESGSQQSLVQNQFKQKHAFQKHNSFEMDESLGILTPDQMKELLMSSASNTNNYDDIPDKSGSKLVFQELRIDQTPSPEELPLDSIEVKTDIDSILNQQQNQQKDITKSNLKCAECASFHTETETSKTDLMNKISVSKISNSFITSVTSVTSLDTGYQGDGEMSRPGSRGASENSSSAMQAQRGVSRQPSFNLQQCYMPPTRRQDPMTDSDFFTESDADDILNKGDRNAHIIDGQLYAGHTLSPIVSVQSRMDDSCMESSGVFTDVENRGEEDLAQVRCQNTNQEINTVSSPNADIDDGSDSTGTVKSNYENTKYTLKLSQCNEKMAFMPNNSHHAESQTDGNKEWLTIQRNARSNNNTTTYSGMDNGVTFEIENATSLNEAFNKDSNNDVLFSFSAQKTQMHAKLPKSFITSTTTSLCEQSLIYVQKVPPVQKVTSPRKYASLSSISTQKNVGFQEANKTTSDCINMMFSKPLQKSNASISTTKTSKLFLRENIDTCKNANLSNVTNKNKPRKVLTQKSDKTDNNIFHNSIVNNKIVNTEKSPTTNLRKYQVPNKWNIVMNQIEKNKLLTKTNYNNVKSKVVARLNMGAELNTNTAHIIPNNIVRRSHTSNKVQITIDKNSSSNLKLTNKCHIKSYMPNGNVNSIDTSNDNICTYKNCINQFDISNKRLHSADKTKILKASQNDKNSTIVGSSKSMTKICSRTAKKRDVRNLSISSTNLGPPSKTQQACNGATAVRCKISSPPTPCMKLTQKRHSSDAKNEYNSISSDISISTVAGTTSPYEGIRNSISNKKSSGNNRRGDLNVKAIPAKDTNRMLNQPVSLTSSPFIKACKQEVESDLHNMVAKKLIDAKYINNNNDNIIDKLVDSTSYTTRIPSSRLTKNQVHSNVIAEGNDGKILEKQDDISNTMASGSQAYQTLNGESSLLKSSTLAVDKISDCHLHESEEEISMQNNAAKAISTQGKSVEALAILLNYLVFDLDAFACPQLKAENLKAKEQLKHTETLLQQTRSAFNDLQNEMCEKENFYERRENELHALHSNELEKAYSELTELRSLTEKQINKLETELCAKDSEIKCTLDSYCSEMTKIITEKDELIKAAEERERLLHQKNTIMAQSEQKLREKITSLETSCAGRLQMAAERENELNERIKCLSTEIKKLRSSKYDSDRDIKDKLNFSQDEIALLRSGRHSLNESNASNYQKNANNSMSLTPHNIELCRLQSEADSLRCVLELKQKEISKLIKQNEELLRDVEEKAALQNKISCLQSKNELLQSELNIKSEKEKGFLRQIDEMQKALNHETVKRTRLSYDNEALQWQLKQRSEQLHIIEAKLSEFSSNNDINYAITLQTRPTSNNLNAINSLPDAYEGSPPPSPIVKGVIEKSDSVSWVLEMDDQTPEVAASKVVKRAGPFRSSERIASARRQLPLAINVGLPSIHSSLNYSNFVSGLESNTLSQSMPNTNIIPEHSKICAIESKNSLHSNSFNIKIGEATSNSARKVQRQYSLQNNEQKLLKMSLSSCKETTDESGLYTPSLHSPTLNLQVDMHQDNEALFKNNLGSKLITCDMSTLNVGEPLNRNGILPKHSTTKGLNIVKLSQEIKESAGEALVSNTNSEDECCSAFSDDAANLASTTSKSLPSPALIRLNKGTSLSMDDSLLIEKIDLSEETKMKLSWGEEGKPPFSNTSSL